MGKLKFEFSLSVSTLILSLARRFRSLSLLLRSAASLADESMADESMADEFKAEESMADNTIPCMAISYEILK